jgi:hypothetical protein
MPASCGSEERELGKIELPLLLGLAHAAHLPQYAVRKQRL